MGGASPRAGQRRQQADSPDPAAERGMLHCTSLFSMNRVLFFPVFMLYNIVYMYYRSGNFRVSYDRFSCKKFS